MNGRGAVMLKMLDLFSGIGGFSLAADWTGGIETVAFCEIEPYCQKVLKKHWPDVPIFEDVKQLNWERDGRWEEYAQNVRKQRLLQTDRIANHVTQKGWQSGEKKIRKDGRKLIGPGAGKRKMRSSIITAGSVFVAEKQPQNSSLLTTNITTEMQKEENINRKHGSSSLKEGSPKTIRYYAITAITQKQIMEYARTKGVMKIDILTAGTPCQPASYAGKQRGTSDDRWLWEEVFRIVHDVQPTWCIFENVGGLLTLEGGLVFDNMLSKMEAEGYEVQPLIIPACAVNAPHRRDRVWILAHSNIDRCNGQTVSVFGRESRQESFMPAGGGKVLADTSSFTDIQTSKTIGPIRSKWDSRDNVNSSGRQSKPRDDWWDIEPDVGRNHDGLSAELDGGRLNETQTGTGEILSDLRKATGEETLQRQVRGLQGLSKQELLQSVVRQYQVGTNQGRVTMESGTTPRECLRCLRFNGESPCSPYQRRYNGQPAGEHPDIMRFLPCQTPSFYPETWADGSWEDGVTRVANGIPNRTHRLKALGNSIVPQVAYQILQGIVDIEEGGNSCK